LSLKLSNRASQTSKKQATQGKNLPKETGTSTKIIIRNVPFEAESKDLRELCKPFGQIKSVRIPKKFDGSSRGFAFVEFLSKQDAKNALEALKGTHLYGRHLVFEYTLDGDSQKDQS
jgi:multiple RNA-binding domain-containing protein 1